MIRTIENKGTSLQETYRLQARGDRIEILLYSEDDYAHMTEKEKKRNQSGVDGEGRMYLLLTDKGLVFLGLGLIREYLVRP